MNRQPGRGVTGGTQGRVGRIAAAWVALLMGVVLPGAADAKRKPAWVERGGVSAAHPHETYLTGFGMAEGSDALPHAKRMAAQDLASRISVRIEAQLSDVSQEQDGRHRYKVAAVTRTTTDVQLSNLEYLTFQHRKRAWALAVAQRSSTARQRRFARDRAVAEMRACLERGTELRRRDRRADALAQYETCRRPVAAALHHDSVYRALLPGAPGDAAVVEVLASASSRLDREIDELLHKPATSLRSAADALALQLSRQGVSKHSRLAVAPFGYGVTSVSSPFGRQVGVELERALARLAAPNPGRRYASLAVRGAYVEDGETLRLSATVREVQSGRLVANAETSLALDSLTARYELVPPNLDAVLRDQRLLVQGGLADGELRVELWTDRGRGGVLYSEREELRLYLRVNRPAWVRLVYVLQNGAKVPIDHGFRIERERAGAVVEYPDRFEVVAPFGVELIHATAFEEPPRRLRTVRRTIAGVDYEVLVGGLDPLVRERGLARVNQTEIAEDFVTVTTTPRNR
jgi:hypothetical protein